VRAALTLAPVALLATSCGAHRDPYANSLAQGSEHVEFRGTVNGVAITGSGDFTNTPDRGRVTVRTPTGVVQQVIDGHNVYTRAGGVWHVEQVAGVQTAAQMLRARVPARIAGDLVRHLEIRSGKAVVSYDFSRYGEKVSVTVPRVKGSK
jgi:hypothetical protein